MTQDSSAQTQMTQTLTPPGAQNTSGFSSQTGTSSQIFEQDGRSSGRSSTPPAQSRSQQAAESDAPHSPFFNCCKDVDPEQAKKMKAGDPYDHAKTLWQTMAIVNSLIIGSCMSALLAGPPTHDQQPASSAPALPVVLNITLSAHQGDSAVVLDALQ
eukprot:jgi/Ulvmu1/2912/UM147_0010.1